MAFTLDGIIIDRIQLGLAENSAGDLLYTLTQLSEATIETSSESKEARDKDGVLVKKFYNGKSATLSATNAMMDFNILGEQAGSGKKTATEEAPMVMPKVLIVDAVPGKEIEVPGVVVEEEVPHIHVNAIANNGTMGKAYTFAGAASSTQFGFDGTSKITLPSDATVERYVIKYDRTVTSGAMIDNRADVYPRTIKLTLKCLAVDQCSPDVLRACYVVFPSFQVSPDTSVALTTDATFDFTGDAQVDYCSKDKQLYYICMAEDDVEE